MSNAIVIPRQRRHDFGGEEYRTATSMCNAIAQEWLWSGVNERIDDVRRELQKSDETLVAECMKGWDLCDYWLAARGADYGDLLVAFGNERRRVAKLFRDHQPRSLP